MRTSVRLLLVAATAAVAFVPAGAHATVCHSQPEASTWVCVTGEEDPYYGRTCLRGNAAAFLAIDVCTPG